MTKDHRTFLCKVLSVATQVEVSQAGRKISDHGLHVVRPEFTPRYVQLLQPARRDA